MTIRYLRPITDNVAISPIRFAVLILMLTLSVGCSTNQSEPDTVVSSANTETPDTETPNPETPGEAEKANSATAIPTTKTDAPVTEPAPDSNSAEQIAQDTPLADGQEPGYVGYPLMGETDTGEVIRYIYSEPLDCTGTSVDSDCNRSVIVNFIQTEPSDPNKVSEGQAVANCARGVLTEVMINNDLVAYELSSPDEAMTQLLNFTCEEAQNTGLISAAPTAAPTIPTGLTEGMPYPEVRSRLVAEGWTPKNVQMSHYTSLEQALYDQGYTEVLGCSGTGLCRFEFDQADALPSDQALVVITAFAESDIYYEGDPLLRSANTDFSVSEDLSATD